LRVLEPAAAIPLTPGRQNGTVIGDDDAFSARSALRLTIGPGRALWATNRMRIDVEGDGPWIAEKLRKKVTRLDGSLLGAGIGLAIVTNILDHYGHELVLERSPLGELDTSLALAT
jgi:nitrogen-specific signal transduction histidine kinase